MSNTELAPLGTLAPALSTDVGKDLAAAGASFGALLLGVGQALAATQKQLCENSADTTTTLAQTMVDVIAVEETIYDDDGTARHSQLYTQKLPLLNFIDPVFYSCPEVHLQGRFVVSELATDSSDTSGTHSSGGAYGAGFSLSQNKFNFGLGGGYNFASQSTSTTAQTDQTSSVGQMRMYARIAPQAGLGVPQPTQVIVGPSLNIVAGKITPNILDTDQVTPITTMEVTFQLRDKTGSPISGKKLSIDTSGTPWSSPGGGDSTDANGEYLIVLKRSFPSTGTDTPPDRSAKPVLVSARLGLITSNLVVTF